MVNMIVILMITLDWDPDNPPVKIKNNLGSSYKFLFLKLTFYRSIFVSKNLESTKKFLNEIITYTLDP